MLKQFKDFSLFSELNGIIHRLEDKVYVEKTHQPAIIHLDKNEHLKGLHHLDTLYQAILKKIVLVLSYQSFKASRASTLHLTPFILKEFNNRWFVIGKKNGQTGYLTLALDRIQQIDFDLSMPYEEENFNADSYYKNTYGVTVLGEEHVEEIELEVDQRNAPYVLTKPFHHSQELITQHPDGRIHIRLHLHLNFELDRLILGFGDSIKVLAPRVLRRRIKAKLKRALQQYES